MTESTTTLRALVTQQPDHGPSSLADEHALLLTEITARARDVTTRCEAGSWPARELDRLLDYLHLELLRQIADEEWLLFGHLHDNRAGYETVRKGHRRLRREIELLADAARASHQSARLLREMVDRLLWTLRDHFEEEARVVDGPVTAPSTSSFGRAPHSWYPILHADVIDLDLLPGLRGVNALVARIMRLSPDQVVEVRATSDLSPLTRRLSRIDPGGYGYTLLLRGPPRWRMEIVRRR